MSEYFNKLLIEVINDKRDRIKQINEDLMGNHWDQIVNAKITDGELTMGHIIEPLVESKYNYPHFLTK